jgi:DNA-binding NarL/FixJ family response regulator
LTNGIVATDETLYAYSLGIVTLSQPKFEHHVGTIASRIGDVEPPIGIPTISHILVRVLVVEDHQPFRQFLRQAMQQRPGIQIVGEVADGLEAVEKTKQLRPDLILLDIGLPTLNGIEVARQIRTFSPESRIIFITQETSSAILEEALTVGAMGYVIKAYAASELITAVETVLRGTRFIGSGLSHLPFSETMLAQRSGGSHDFAPFSQATNKPPCDHDVQFYSEEEPFLLSLSRFIEDGLLGGNVVIVVVTEPHRRRLLQILKDQGVATATAVEQGRFVHLEATETLSTFMQDGEISQTRFFSIFGRIIHNAEMVNALMHKRILVFGEMVAVLCERGQVEAVIQLERMWNELARTRSFYLLCGYPVSEVRDGGLYEKICAEHSTVFSAL